MELRHGITIVGAGNVAWHLAFGFRNAGININGVFSRSMASASGLAGKLGTFGSVSLKEIPSDTDMVLICVTDSAVGDVIKNISKDLTVVHTSGSLPISVLGRDSTGIGVFYPYQTFSKNVNTGNLSFPVCIEANDDKVLEKLKYLANKISDRVVLLNSEDRKRLHVSGVVVNNFTNHLMACAFEFLENHHIDSTLLVPILEETIRKIKNNHPKDVQTGPAVRGDSEIIKKHLALLESNQSLQAIYKLMSLSIMDYYSKCEK
jgi:predicted short-subunit dehydrogenase-like oxidoreductase (DUF2520 family)